VDAGDAWAGLGRTSCTRDRPARARPLATAARPLQEHTHAVWVQVPHRLPPWCLSPASSLFDSCASRHLKVAEMVDEQANCLFESRHDVVILLAGIARLARPASIVGRSRGKVWSGGAEGWPSAPKASSSDPDPQIDPSCRARSELRTVSGRLVLTWPRE
jgi:hypothetical protein